MSTTLCILLDTRRVKTSKKYPGKLRVTSERSTQYYQTIFDLSKEDYDKLTASRISNELQSIRNKLKEFERTAENAVNELDPFNFVDFEKYFFQKKKIKVMLTSLCKNEFDFSPFYKKFPLLLEEKLKSGNISITYQTYIKKVLRVGLISTSLNYYSSYISLKKFHGDVRFSEITVSYLNDYENLLKEQNVSKTTVGKYLRQMRSIFNEAIEEGKEKNVMTIRN